MLFARVLESDIQSQVVVEVRGIVRLFKQLPLGFKCWGGARRGAGRKRKSVLPQVPHRVRLPHRARHPQHITVRCRCRSLRTQFVFPSVVAVFRAVNRRAPSTFRVVEFSVQANHIHLIVEAEDSLALSSGMRSLTIRLARNVNSLLMQRGPFIADRWYGHELVSARAVRHALVYVLANHKKHLPATSEPIDHYSSAPYFTYFAERPIVSRFGSSTGPPPTASARTWLLAIGWRQHYPLISMFEHPRAG